MVLVNKFVIMMGCKICDTKHILFGSKHCEVVLV